jgi:hypothetical protein
VHLHHEFESGGDEIVCFPHGNEIRAANGNGVVRAPNVDGVRAEHGSATGSSPHTVIGPAPGTVTGLFAPHTALRLPVPYTVMGGVRVAHGDGVVCAAQVDGVVRTAPSEQQLQYQPPSRVRNAKRPRRPTQSATRRFGRIGPPRSPRRRRLMQRRRLKRRQQLQVCVGRGCRRWATRLVSVLKPPGRSRAKRRVGRGVSCPWARATALAERALAAAAVAAAGGTLSAWPPARRRRLARKGGFGGFPRIRHNTERPRAE